MKSRNYIVLVIFILVVFCLSPFGATNTNIWWHSINFNLYHQDLVSIKNVLNEFNHLKTMKSLCNDGTFEVLYRNHDSSVELDFVDLKELESLLLALEGVSLSNELKEGLSSFSISKNEISMGYKGCNFRFHRNELNKTNSYMLTNEWEIAGRSAIERIYWKVLAPSGK